MPPPLLSIAIATYRRSGYLRVLLESIQNEVEADSLQVEVVVNDNASGDDTPDVIGSFGALHPSYECNETNLGPVENVIRAYSRSTGDYVLLMGDDDVVEPGSLRRIVDVANSAARPGLITGPVTGMAVDGRVLDETVRFPNLGGADREFKPGGDAVEHTFLRATTLSGLCMRRDIADPAGARTHADSLYPQMYLAGVAARDGGAVYLAAPVAAIRDNPVRAWSYSSDLMGSGVFAILDEITRDAPWGPAVRKTVTARRVRAAYGPLYEARLDSFRNFLRVFRGLASVSQYRRSPTFWAMGLAVGLLGIRGMALFRRMVRIKGPDQVR